MTSARSAGPRASPILLTLPTQKAVGSVLKVMGCGTTSTGCGRKPPSVPICRKLGPRLGQDSVAPDPVHVPGSGTSPTRPSIGQSGGQLLAAARLAAAGAILTSVKGDRPGLYFGSAGLK